jgi:rare lipoprotein A
MIPPLAAPRPVSAFARLLSVVVLGMTLAACGTTPRAPDGAESGSPGQQSGGAYYKDDGPHAVPPADLDRVPDAVPRDEPLHRYANRPYNVFGQEYVPATEVKPFRQRGVASWYGRRFHGKPTSSGEPYDMYAMTAAHPTLPIPSYVRVTNLANGRSVVVRVNDRGPFLRNRIIDLSYAAAHRLGYINAGHADVEVELIVPGSGDAQPARAMPAPAPVVATSPAAPAAAGAEAASGQVYLQLGVFSSRANAEDLRGRVQRELAALADRVLLLADGDRFRLHLGPWGSEGEARRVAEQIARTLNLQPFLVAR